ncbi:hypothetical protein GQ53DRAFT_800907 [Thozetella sp. PMI_491]|nr:hypothetical protein GQ53DRAFT_800907 [Thozetella sp. PMI_491]
MDPVSLSASIIAFIQAADRVIAMCRYCIDSIKDAPKDMQIILGEIMSLRAMMDNFGADVLHANTANLVPVLFGKLGPIETCGRCLSALEKLLPTAQEGTGKTRQLGLAELAWPLKRSKAQKLLAEIAQQKATLLLAMSGSMIHDIKDIRSGVQRVERELTYSQRQEVTQWIESENPSSLHNEAFRKHENHTSSWLLQAPEWLAWMGRVGGGASRLLWIHGIPGSGKTVLASFIIEHLRRSCTGNPELGHAYYYCHYSHEHDEAGPFLRWVIGKLCRQAQWIPPRLKSIYDEGCDPGIPELEGILEDMAKKFKAVYIVIDAVDESCPREDLLAVIATLAIDKRMFSGVSVSIAMSNLIVEKDIRAFVRAKMNSNYLMRRWQPMFPTIENSIVAGAQGMFRWAECQIQMIERLRDETQLGEVLRNLPSDLAETYIRILQRIPPADWTFFRRILVWVSGHARAPWLRDRGINANLLLKAVAYDQVREEGHITPKILHIDQLKELAGCLFTFGPGTTSRIVQLFGQPQDGIPLKDNEIFVRLAHYTVLELLESPFIARSSVSHFSLCPMMVKREFTRSILYQALGATEVGGSPDWVTGREAYCLTLACAMYIGDFSDEPELQDLFIQYFTPTRPHYSRIVEIQRHIIFGSDSFARAYYLCALPVYQRGELESQPLLGQAATLLNILLIAGSELGERFLTGRDRAQILDTKLSSTWIEGFFTVSEDPAEIARTLEGTVREILLQRSYGPPTGIMGAMRSGEIASSLPELM